MNKNYIVEKKGQKLLQISMVEANNVRTSSY